MRTNSEFLRSLSTPVARFYLSDFHVHSPGSADIRIGERYEALSKEEKACLTRLSSLPENLSDYDAEIHKQFPVEDFYKLLLARRDYVARDQGITDGGDRAFVCITDHNVAHYASLLSKYAWEQRKNDRLIVLPGIELDVSFHLSDSDVTPCKVHILCIFAPGTESSDIRVAITKASDTNWSFGSSLTVKDLPAFVERIRGDDTYPAICIAAHVSSSKGIQKEAKISLLNNLDATIARVEGEIAQGCDVDEADLQKTLESLKRRQTNSSDIHQQVLRLIGSCGFDALQVRGKQEETHYRRLHRFRPEKGRAIPITCSDSHCVDTLFLYGGTTSYLKLSGIDPSNSPSDVFNEIRERGLRYGETRSSYTYPGSVTTWIEGIEIVPEAKDAATFWPFESSSPNSGQVSAEESFTLSLSRNLNCLIGGRGSGKSAAIEAIGFVARPEDALSMASERKDKYLDWYKRSMATLSGCSVRICWKSTGKDGFDQLKKKSLFVSRYFDPSHRHERPQVTDFDGKEILSHSVEPPQVKLFRIHEIEEAAQPEKLRELFDQICGDEIDELNGKIEQFRQKLAEQRTHLVDVAKAIAQLFDEPSALREYAKRKQQFLDVNRPDVKEKYQVIDDASAAELISLSANDDWTSITDGLSLNNAQAKIEEFFDEVEAKVKDQEGNTKPNCEVIYELIGAKDGDSDEPRIRENVLASIASAENRLGEFGQELSGAHEQVSEIHKDAREELAKHGLPAGGKDREAKKKAFEQAEEALEQYRSLIHEWDDLISARRRAHETLEGQCVRRTELRKQTAEQLTSDLARDLDSSVLVIEADAQPVAERGEFLDWLSSNVGSKGWRSRDVRVQCLVEKNLQPADLRELLLSVDGRDHQLLIVDKPRVQDGQIDEAEAKSMVARCTGRSRLALELTNEEVDEECWANLPEEIKEGLWGFPKGESELKVDAVLQLDEIVFDDIPIIRLNDRPSDSQSTPRPLDELSAGQRCSAILPILLLTGNCPLIIDQPEDNLDNRLIRQVIVNILASIKLRRQVIVATHNPNLPVLGDAEQAVILRAVRDRRCKVEARGDLDSSNVVRYVTDIMEGGREAFQYRQTIYQSHWRGSISE